MPDDIPEIKPSSILEPPHSEAVLPEGQHELAKRDNITAVTTQQETMTKKTKNERFNFKFNKKIAMIFGGVLLFFVLFFIVLGVAIGVPGYSLYKQAFVLKDSATKLEESLSSKDINIIESQYGEFKNEFGQFDDKFQKVYWLRRMPFVGYYVEDAHSILEAGKLGLETGDIAIETIKPYADIVGLGGEDDGEGQNANDRIDFLVSTIDEVLPQLDKVNSNLAQIQSIISSIDTSKYPEEFRGIVVRDRITKAKQDFNEGVNFLRESKPLLERASYHLGVEEPREYLLLFQNDKELRATGGFLTAYSIIKVTNGKIENVKSSDIYDLDANYTPAIEAPDPIKDYLKGPYLISENFRIRDINWNPDFTNSMELFAKEAEKAGIKDVDGIIAVDTHVVVNLLNAIGPIAVPGYGDFSTNNDERCNCPQVIYELESFADVEGPVVWNQDGSGEIIFAPENYGRRKEIIGPLMNSILTNALGQPSEKMSALFEAAWRSVTEKHVLVYLFDEKAQSGAEGANLAGRLNTEYAGDYLHINDSNLGGRKSNLYVTHEVVQDIEIDKSGIATKTVTITYANPQDYDGWLNSVLPNWARIYVPKGSELISAEGFDKETETYEENGKTVFAGGFELRPNGLQKIVLKYKLPIQFNGEYGLLVQKQPGKDFILHTINVNNKTQELFLRTDKEFNFKL